MLKKLLAGVTTLALALGMVAATAGTASAHTPSVTSTCSTLTLDLTNYADTVIGVEGSPGSPAEYETVTITDHKAVPAVETTYVQEWLYVKVKNATQHDEKYESFNWNHGASEQDQGWIRQDTHRDTGQVLVEGTPEIPAFTHTEQKLVKEATEPVEAISGKTNTVKVVIDGATAEDTTFGTTFKKGYDYTDSAVAHEYTVTVEAWDGSQYSFTKSGTSVPCSVPPTVKLCSTIGDGGVSTNLNANGWTFTETRATGHNDYVSGGLQVYTEGANSTDKAAGYHALSIPLGRVGEPSISLTGATGVLPGLQLGVDRDGNGTWDGYLVNEGDLYGHGNWWTSKAGFGVPAGMGYASLGTLNDYLAANPNAKVVNFGYSLGSGVKGDSVIKQITVGCKKYTFDHVAPIQPEAVVTHSPISTSDCQVKTVTTVDTISTTTFVLNEYKTEYVRGEPVTTTETTTQDMTNAERAECRVVVVPPVRPDPTVSTRAVSTDTISCATSKVNTVTEHYTTTTTYVYNAETNSYKAVKGDEVRGEDTSSSRSATPEECPVIIPGKPGAVVTNTTSTAIDCGTTIVTTRSSTTTVDFKLVNNVWVKQAPVTVQDAETSRPATDAECGLPTFALVTPVVTSVDRTCTVNGSYALGMVDGVIYTVNGRVQEPGTYQVSTAKTVDVVASLTSADFGFEQGAVAVRNLKFTDPKNCGELPTLALPGSNGTLAFTGSNGTLAGGLLLGLLFVLFGAGVITVNRVNKRNS